MGVVYEAFDRERKVKVALKTLRSMSPESLLNFKGEFRTFQNLQHPNLVNVGELHSDGSIWFFSMELVEGVNFLSWVRPRIRKRTADTPSVVSAPTVPQPISWAGHTMSSGGSDNSGDGWREPRLSMLQEPRLRNALRQLALGLIALHDAGKVHRDIKPSNVFVTPQGRVVILDFGLATEIARRGNTEVNVVGTVDYMAPEQAAARQVGPEADWYSVGVMIYEALTGELPLKGPTMEVLMKKQQLDAPRPRALAPDIPEDLDELCADLLHFNPSQRPDGRAVLKRLGEEVAQSVSSSFSSVTQSHFIGRERELSVLREAFERSRRGARAVAVFGESGVGKSSLVRHFTQQCKDRESQAVVLAGTCFERENVPYKAVDGIVDTLSRYMSKLPLDEASALLPRRASLLAEVFPVLKRVEAVALAPRSQEGALDPYELRNRLFAALRELFVRLADRHPVVLVVDDLQWADADSLALFAELLREPESPALLLVATVRRAADEEGLPRSLIWMEPLKLDRLSPPEARELATVLLHRARMPSGLKPHSIAQEAGGHPLFIDELIRHAASLGAPTTALQLEDALWERISHLDPAARTVLELTCLASGRLAQQTAAQAANTDFGEFAKHVQLLRVAHLLRTTGMRGSDRVEPYHGRVRTAVVEHLDPELARAHHRRLALALETSGQPDPEALCVHWREVGEKGKAAHFALMAAEKAQRALAFDRAAHFYEICVEMAPPDDPQLRTLRLRLADALANAGRSGEAGDAYLRAAEGASTSEALERRRRAAEQLLISGHIDRGLATLREVLSAAGMSLAQTPRRALMRLLWSRARVKLHGLKFREREPGSIPLDQLTRIDICWSAGIALGLVDSLRGADFQARNLLLSLKAGEPYRVARALAMEAGYTALEGTQNAERTAHVQREALLIAERVNHPHANGLVKLMTGIAAFLEGRWRDCCRHCEESEQVFRERCSDVSWELDNAQLYPLWSRIFLGELGGVGPRAWQLLRESRGRGDRYLETNLLTRVFNMVWLAADDPDAARRDVREGIATWSQEGFHLQNYFAVHSNTEIDLYEGRGLDALGRIEKAWPQIRKSDFWILQLMRIETLALRARCLVAAAKQSRDDAYAKEALLLSKDLLKEGAPWAMPFVHQIRATTNRSRADFHNAIEGFERAGMSLFAMSLRHRAGEGELAREWMVARGVRNPDRMIDLYAPALPE
jgi:serine/threonine protein kinase